MRSAVIECGMVCLVGAGASLLALFWLGGALAAVLPPLLARYADSAADARTVGIVALLWLLCTLGAGLVAGVRMAGTRSVAGVLGGSGTGQRRKLRGGATVLALEAALGVVLVLGAAGTVRSFGNLVIEGVGYDPRGLYDVSIRPDPNAGPPVRLTPQEALDSYTSHVQLSRDLPGVVAVGGSDSTVTSGATALRGFSTEGGARGGLYEVTAGYFSALRAPLLAGREFTDEEVRAKAPVLLLNREALAQVLPDLSPDQAIGRSITLSNDVPRTIIGVVATLRSYAGEDGCSSVFVPLGNDPARYGSWSVRLGDDSAETADRFREALQSRVGGRVAIRSAADAVAPGLLEPRFRAVLFGGFALCGLLIAASGILAVTWFSVAQRRQEMGVRLTLGATSRDLIHLVVREVLTPVMVGAAGGVVIAFWLVESLQALLYRVDAYDPPTLVLVVAVLLMTALAAAWIPARRASQVDPASVLRSEL